MLWALLWTALATPARSDDVYPNMWTNPCGLFSFDILSVVGTDQVRRVLTDPHVDRKLRQLMGDDFAHLSRIFERHGPVNVDDIRTFSNLFMVGGEPFDKDMDAAVIIVELLDCTGPVEVFIRIAGNVTVYTEHEPSSLRGPSYPPAERYEGNKWVNVLAYPDLFNFHLRQRPSATFVHPK